eukprot:COSAG02_NODE_1239_length_13713_cov_37.434259_8_plen_52_part_00
MLSVEQESARASKITQPIGNQTDSETAAVNLVGKFFDWTYPPNPAHNSDFH